MNITEKRITCKSIQGIDLLPKDISIGLDFRIEMGSPLFVITSVGHESVRDLASGLELDFRQVQTLLGEEVDQVKMICNPDEYKRLVIKEANDGAIVFVSPAEKITGATLVIGIQVPMIGWGYSYATDETLIR